MKSKYLTCVIAALWFWAPALQLRGIPLWVNLGGGGGAPDAPVDPGYDPYTAVFDGTNDYARRTASALSNVSASKVFTFACWIKPDTDGTVRTVFCIGTGSTNRFQLAVQSTNVFSVFGANSSGTTILSISSTNTILAGGWKHVLVCIDMDDYAKTRIYFNGVAETIITATFTTGGTIDLAPGTNPRWTIGGNSSTTPGTLYSGELADLLFEDVYLDDPTKFIVTAGPYPVNPGANGSTAFGAAVPVYLSASGNGNSWANNSGTGGALTLTGTLGTGTPP